MTVFECELQKMFRWAIIKAAKNHREVDSIERRVVIQVCEKAFDSLIVEGDFPITNKLRLTRSEWKRLDRELLEE